MIKILVIGHSFVKRFQKDVLRESKHEQICVQEVINLRGSRIIPYFLGTSGANIADVPTFENAGVKQNPTIIIVDIGQNDLCWSSQTPRQYAEALNLQVRHMFDVYPNLELVVICQVTFKTQKIFEAPRVRTDKKLTVLNDDIDRFNYEIMKLTRHNLKIVRYRHRGMKNPVKPVSEDGTHPDSTSGKWKYMKSISAMCRMAKQDVMDRRTLSKTALRKKQGVDRLERRTKRSKLWTTEKSMNV